MAEESLFRLIDDYISNKNSENERKLTEYLKNNPKSFYAYKDNKIPLYTYALKDNAIDVLKLIHSIFLENNYPINVPKPYNLKDSNGLTPLHNAILLNSNKAARFLIENINVDPNITDSEFNTSLHLTCKYKRRDILKSLIYSDSNITNINALNKDYNSPLYLCAQNNDVDLARVLLLKGAKNSYYVSNNIIKNIQKEVVELSGSDQMKKLFKQFSMQKYRSKKSKTRKSIKNKTIKDMKSRYDFVCGNLMNTNIDIVSQFAKNLQINQYITNEDGLDVKKSKELLCNDISNRIRMLSIAPQIIN